MTEAGWDVLRDDLARRIAALADGEFVILGEPVVYGEPTGRFRRRPRPLPNRFVQFLRMGVWVSGECVGSTLFGGDYDIPSADHERLRSLGWMTPDDLVRVNTTPGYPNYRCDFPREDSARLARMGTDALQVLGLSPSDVGFGDGS